jgi:hypothetical protein
MAGGSDSRNIFAVDPSNAAIPEDERMYLKHFHADTKADARRPRLGLSQSVRRGPRKMRATVEEEFQHELLMMQRLCPATSGMR